MKILFKNISLVLLILAFLAACRQEEKKDNGEDTETEQYGGEEKSRVTETGQNIGNNTDSTSVDGEPGNPSNN